MQEAQAKVQEAQAKVLAAQAEASAAREEARAAKAAALLAESKALEQAEGRIVLQLRARSQAELQLPALTLSPTAT